MRFLFAKNNLGTATLITSREYVLRLILIGRLSLTMGSEQLIYTLHLASFDAKNILETFANIAFQKYVLRFR